MRPTLPLLILLAACTTVGAEDFGEGNADWPKLIAGATPEGWSRDDDRREVVRATVTVTHREEVELDAAETMLRVGASPSKGVGAGGVQPRTLLTLTDAEGSSLSVALPRLPKDCRLPNETSLSLTLYRRQGFGGTAGGLVLQAADDQLLLLYDDGGYGSALQGDAEALGLDVAASKATPNGGWVQTVLRVRASDGASVEAPEGDPVDLGGTGLRVWTLACREWTGGAITDADTSPTAYMIYRAP
jgi:hypothetical protein